MTSEVGLLPLQWMHQQDSKHLVFLLLPLHRFDNFGATKAPLSSAKRFLRNAFPSALTELMEYQNYCRKH